MNKIILTTDELTACLPELLENDGWFPLGITGWSMRPLLRQGRDIVWLQACPEGTYKRGQILLFRRDNGRFVLHRVRKVLPDHRYRMNGDAQDWCEIIREDQVYAVVSEIQRGGKRISCNDFRLRIYNAVWHPTLKYRKFLFRIGSGIKKVLWGCITRT